MFNCNRWNNIWIWIRIWIESTNWWGYWKIRNTTIDKLCFDLDKKINIENNLFEYSFYGTKIIDFPDEIKLKTGKTNIQKDFILLQDKCLFISFPTEEGIYKANSYTIEIAYIVRESDNGDLDSYTQKEFIGKYSNFTSVIKNDIYFTP